MKHSTESSFLAAPLKALRQRVRFDRNELAGSFGDVGTDLPLILAMIPAAGLHTASVFIMFGFMQVVTGVLYGLPMPMQPLKIMAMIVITQRISGDVLHAAGLAIGLVMVCLSFTGALTLLARAIPQCVVRGIQMGLGFSLASLALKTYLPADGSPGYVLAGVAACMVILLWGNRKLPAALPVVLLGLIYALFSSDAAGAVTKGVAFQLPQLQLPAWADIATGFLVLTLPQLPLSLSNSVIATQQTLHDLYPEKGVSVKRIGLTYGFANIINSFFSGIPVCHGCGGLAGHYAFGARTGGSVVLYGLVYLVLGLAFSHSAEQLVQLFPSPLLGVLLGFEALALIMLARDAAASQRDYYVAVLVALMALGLPQGYLVGLLTGSAVYYLSNKLELFKEPAGPAR